MARNEASYKMDATLVQAQRDINVAVRQPQVSFGIQLLDRAKESEGIISKWLFSACFVGYVLIDYARAGVRPITTYGLLSLYASYKLAVISRLYEITESINGALINDAAFTSFDRDLLLLCVAYYFGSRVSDKFRNKGKT